MASSKVPKYRPYLSINQINYFLHLAENDNRAETEVLRALTVKELKLFITKNSLGAVTPQYIAEGRKSVADRLGMSIDPAARREQLHNLWKQSPQLLSDSDLRQVQLYRYENNLMSEAEEEQYETSI